MPKRSEASKTELLHTEQGFHVLYNGSLRSLGLVMQKSEYALTAGMKFGDLSLEGSSSGKMRSATIVTSCDSHFAVLKRSDYDVMSC